MSWEGVSCTTSRLFHNLGQIEEFTLPDIHEKPMYKYGRHCHGLVEWLHDLDQRMKTRGMSQDAIDLPHTVLSFQVAPFDWPAEWNSEWMNQESFQEATTSLHEDILLPGTGQVSQKRVLEPDVYTRAPNLIDAPGYFYVLPNKRRRRLLLDERAVEVVDIPVTCSQSDIDEQLSWVHRVRVPKGYEKMIIDPPESPGEGERHPRISNDQLGGFLAALTEFTSWPQSFFGLLPTEGFSLRWSPYRQMKRNLECQSLIEQAYNTLGWRLSNSVDEKLFYKILSIVGYDYQVAHFVCLPSTSGLVAAAKVQLASLIVSQRSYLEAIYDCLTLKEQGRLDSTYRVGLFREDGLHSTLTMALGVMKLMLAGIAGLASSDMDTDSSGIDFGDYVEHIKWVQAKCKLLIDAFIDAHVPIVDVASFSCDEQPLTLDQYGEVVFHLGKAFSYQAAYTGFGWDGKICFTENMFTLRKYRFSKPIMDLHSWAQSDTEHPYYNGIVCFYTRIRCDDEASPRTIMDFTCLPTRFYRRWNEYVASRHASNLV
ncbi:uncharacterized protein FIESC28_04069 [Fusarium coffeatum]|uniref:Uncharacterized protein n=1 Tax=Fusarium coffeatum TaxID=231269 RepID=A0A366S1B1_9HYPO|nr:uncharacterized protein FIESC28_04069 [Fusarium coffeatum]RBR23074.1 hypothetical protein FIESC28_04069 [Fusarium coffeatum]